MINLVRRRNETRKLLKEVINSLEEWNWNESGVDITRLVLAHDNLTFALECLGPLEPD